jgi:hypothetical protein
MKIAVLSAGREKAEPTWVKLVQAQVEAMRYGVVQVVVHDSRVVQIERTEKLRLDKGEPQHQSPGAFASEDIRQQLVPPAKETSLKAAPGEDLTADQATGGYLKP